MKDGDSVIINITWLMDLEMAADDTANGMALYRGRQASAYIGLHWPQMGQIWVFLISVFSTFWLGETDLNKSKIFFPFRTRLTLFGVNT